MFEIKVNKKWYGDRIAKSLYARISKNILAALNHYRFALMREIGVWGSDFITSTKRIRRRHSSPGESPLKQTGNLYKSIKTEIGGPSGLTGNIYSDVPYAKTLELGGVYQESQDEKSHTTVRLINPLKNPVSIAPRPAWVPVLKRETDKIIKILVRK